jgi:hypothetical protein
MARSIVVLKLSPKVKTVITFAQSVASAMTNNPSFPNPTPPLATFQADIAALVQAETAALGRAKGAVETRDDKLAVVKSDLEKLRTYVQGVAAIASPSSADALIEAAGMAVRETTLHDKPVLAVRQGSVSGTVTVAAKAVAKSATYFWEYSTDQKTWTSLPMTAKAKTGLAGLTPATTYYFRFQAFTRAGLGDWSQIVTFLVK